METKVITKEPIQSKIQQNQPKQVEQNQPKKQIQQSKSAQQTKTTTAFNSSQTKLQTKTVVNQPKKVPKPTTTSSLKSATLIKPSVSAGIMQSSKFAKTAGPFAKPSVVKTTKKKPPVGEFEEAHRDVIVLMEEYSNLE